jgi:hypothetical protein
MIIAIHLSTFNANIPSNPGSRNSRFGSHLFFDMSNVKYSSALSRIPPAMENAMGGRYVNGLVSNLDLVVA